MQLNLPIYEQLLKCKNLLIAGMGGGFDIFSGLPLYFELKKFGQNVHLASYSFTDVMALTKGEWLTDTCVGVQGEVEGFHIYYPEGYLSEWFKLKRGEDVPIWLFAKTGVRPLLENYRALVKHLNIDGILLIDGGVDSLIFGDESELGTPLEDSTSLYVVNALPDIPLKIQTCVGFGAELAITHAHVLENIAELTQAGAFYGSCSLVKAMESYQLYEDAVLYVQGKPHQDSSVISSSIISAVRGEYGNYHLTKRTADSGSKLWISPLMPLYWFFNLPAVAERNVFLSQLGMTDTFIDVFRMFAIASGVIQRRRYFKIPLP